MNNKGCALRNIGAVTDLKYYCVFLNHMVVTGGSKGIKKRTLHQMKNVWCIYSETHLLNTKYVVDTE